MSEAPQAENASLSIDAAVAALDAPAEAAKPSKRAAAADEAPAEAGDEAEEITTESEADPTAEDVDDPDELAIEDEDADDADPDEGPAINAPASWDAEERAEFAKLPREAQEIILTRETERDKRVSKALQEAGDAKKRAEVEASGIGEYKANLDQLVTRAQAQFGANWNNVDWATWAKQDPDAALQGRFQYEAEQAELGRLEKAHQAAEAIEFQNFVTAEAAKLKDVAPHLADPKEGKARIKAVSQYLLDSGVPAQSLRHISALELSLADKARRWDEAQAALKKPRTAPAPATAAPGKPAVRPSAGQPVGGQKRQAQVAQNRFAQTRSIDDAVAMLNQQG